MSAAQPLHARDPSRIGPAPLPPSFKTIVIVCPSPVPLRVLHHRAGVLTGPVNGERVLRLTLQDDSPENIARILAHVRAIEGGVS